MEVNFHDWRDLERVLSEGKRGGDDWKWHMYIINEQIKNLTCVNVFVCLVTDTRTSKFGTRLPRHNDGTGL